MRNITIDKYVQFTEHTQISGHIYELGANLNKASYENLTEDDLEKITFGSLLKIMTVKRVYKYISFDNGLKYLIENNRLKFSSPDIFNDPFDCNPILFDIDISKQDMKEFLGKLPYNSATKKLIMKNFNKKNLIESLHYKRSNTRIYCFSETNKDNLLWAHYGDYHRGLCIGFEFPIKYKDEFVLYPVNYSQELEIVKFKEDSNRVLYYWLTTKAPEWQYEKEIRAISINNQDYCTFDKSHIKEIVLGYKLPKYEKDKLIDTLKKNGYSRDLEINRIDIDKTNLQLKIKKIGIPAPARVPSRGQAKR